MAYRVLSADDEEIIRQGIEFLVDWERLDCSIVERCANGQEVIRFLEQSPSGVDIIISDIRMAGADGLDIARYVSQNQIPVQVIFLTAYADFSYAKTAIEYSVTDFVLKSDISEGLPRAVEKAKALLAQKQEEQKKRLDAEKLSRQNRRYHLESLLRSVALGTGPRAYDNLKDEEPYCVVTFEVTDSPQAVPSSGPASMAEPHIIRTALMDYDTVMIGLSSRQCCGIIFLDKSRHTAGGLVKALHDTIHIVEEYLKADAFAGVSREHLRMQDLEAAYQQSILALNNVFYSRNRVNCFDPKITDGTDSPVLPSIQQLIESLSEALRSDSPETILGMLEDYCASFIKSGEPFHIFKKNMLSVYTVLTADVKQMDMMDEWEMQKADESFYTTVETSKTFFGIYESLRKYLALYLRLRENFSGTQSSLIRQVNSYIHKNYNQNISLQTIADTFLVSCGHLSRLYRKETGVSLISAINNRRIEVAKRLLKDPRNRVFEVARAVGIEEPTYFTHLFTQVTGVSPSAYRKQLESLGGHPL